MSLTSIYYLLFLAGVVAIYYSIKHEWRVYLLLLASFTFYYVNQRWYLIFLLASILVNYGLCALWLRSRYRYLIILAVCYNILVLAFFKYIPVILFGSSIPDDSIWNKLILPIGISFFSFQAIGYVLDLYWTDSRKQVSLSHFSLYMSFFPHLLSGPVARAKSFMPQISKAKVLGYEDVVAGCRRILYGLFKKLVIANNLSPFTNAVFGNVEMHYGFTFVLATVLFTVQVYADFSGYSDIAIGSARLLGFKLLENFKAPLLSVNITDFWRRWHISLSSWVRDYVHLPIQFKTRDYGRYGVVLATTATFLIIGIWHGASWSYVVFGLIMSLAVTMEDFTMIHRSRLKKALRLPDKLTSLLSTMLVFAFMSSCIVLLYGNSMNEIGIIVSRVNMSFSKFYFGRGINLLSAATGLLVIIYPEMLLKRSTFDGAFTRILPLLRWVYYISFIVLIMAIGEFNDEAFIYYQF